MALAFLKERGCVVPARGKKNAAAWKLFFFEDAMTEYHALREKGAEHTPEQGQETSGG